MNDGDSFGIWDNEILYNAVIPPMNNRHFNYEADGSTVEVKYSLEQEYHSILMSSGNLIGKIANATTQVSNSAQELGYKNTESGVIHTFSGIKEVFLLGNPDKQKLDNLEYKISRFRLFSKSISIISSVTSSFVSHCTSVSLRYFLKIRQYSKEKEIKITFCK